MRREDSVRNLTTIFFICFFGLVSCGKNNESGKSGSGDDEPNYDDGPYVNQQNIQGMHFDWRNVPAQFNPQVFTKEFDSRGLRKIDLMIVGIVDEINVTYDNNLFDRGIIEIYRVRSGNGSFGTVSSRFMRDKLNVINYARNPEYNCLSRVHNRQLIELQGACNLFVRVVLPTSSQIEVYSRGRIYSKRFSPMGFEQLMDRLNTDFNQNKLEAVEEYISSHKQINRPLQLSSFQLEQVLRKFTFTDDFKYTALLELYPYVSDQRNVEQAINNSFSFPSYRDKAKRMVGIS